MGKRQSIQITGDKMKKVPQHFGFKDAEQISFGTFNCSMLDLISCLMDEQKKS